MVKRRARADETEERDASSTWHDDAGAEPRKKRSTAIAMVLRRREHFLVRPRLKDGETLRMDSVNLALALSPGEKADSYSDR